MNKSLYYIECTCIKDCHYPNVDYKVGEVVYYNPRAASREVYVLRNDKTREYVEQSELSEIRWKYGWTSYLPFTRQKKNAKKWQIKSYADSYASQINEIGEFNCVVKEIKVTYSE